MDALTPMELRLRPASGGARDDAALLQVYVGTHSGTHSGTRVGPDGGPAGLAAAEPAGNDRGEETQRERVLRLQHEVQRRETLRHCPRAVPCLIEARGGPVALGTAWQAAGSLWRDERPQSLHLMDLALLPAWRGLGIGTRVLRRLMAEAAAAERALTVHTLAEGDPLQAWYLHLGFAHDGPAEGVRQRLAWRSAAVALALMDRREPPPAPDDALA